MKLRGEFLVRELSDDIVAIPMGHTALTLNGMILLNQVSKVIWECLEKGYDIPQMVTAVTETFEVSPEEAQADIVEFVGKLRQANLLDE